MIFSTKFPSYHPKAGQPTYFVEKIFTSLADSQFPNFKIPKEFKEYDFHKYYNCIQPKYHTIRAGHRFKVGDKFSPRIWSGKPYHSKQIIIAPDIEVKKTWYFEISEDRIFIESDYDVFCKEYTDNIAILAQNDGLQKLDFIDWFTLAPSFKKAKSFKGQIICWNEEINY